MGTISSVRSTRVVRWGGEPSIRIRRVIYRRWASNLFVPRKPSIFVISAVRLSTPSLTSFPLQTIYQYIPSNFRQTLQVRKYFSFLSTESLQRLSANHSIHEQVSFSNRSLSKASQFSYLKSYQETYLSTLQKTQNSTNGPYSVK